VTRLLLCLALLAPVQDTPAAPDPAANEATVLELLKQLVQAEAAWGRDHGGKRASFLDLILARQLPADLRDGIASGYRFKLTLGENLRTFEATATPLEYGRTGTRSFFADRKGVRGEDARGGATGGKAPLLAPAEK
jgi:hypothetical protein